MHTAGHRKIYFGWWIVIVTGIITGIASVFSNQGASVLFKPIASELGLDRTAASVAVGIGFFANGFVFAFAGWLSAKFGPKWVAFSGACITAAGMLLMRLVSSASWYYVVWGLLIVGGFTLGFQIALDAMMTNWFVRKRGLSFSVRWGIISLLGVAMLPLLSWLIQAQGWRTTCMIWGGIMLASIPFVLYFVKQKRPEYYGLLPDGASPQPGAETSAAAMIATGKEYAAGVQEIEFTFKQAVKTSSYWMITLGWVLFMIVAAGFNLHIVPYLTDRNIDPVAAGSMLALMTFFTLPSRIFGGLIADRIKKEHLKFLLAGSLFLVAIGITVLLLSPTMSGIYILLILFGLGCGAYTPLDTLVRGRYFGRKAYGSIQGLSMLISTPLAFLSPIYTGWIYDTTGTYITAFTLFAILAAVGGLAMCLMRVPKSLPAS